MRNPNICDSCQFRDGSSDCKYQTEIDLAKRLSQGAIALIHTSEAVGDMHMSENDTEKALRGEAVLRSLGEQGCEKAGRIILTFDALRGKA